MPYLDEACWACAIGDHDTDCHASQPHIGQIGSSRQTVTPYPQSAQRYSPLECWPAAWS